MSASLQSFRLASVNFFTRICKKPNLFANKYFCTNPDVSYLPLANGNKLAYKSTPGENPGVVFCPGFQSNMQGVKAMALEEYCRKKGLAFLRFDYQGCGQSTGDLRDATLTDWRSDVMNVLDQLTAGPQIIVGSSLGGWLMLATALERPHRIHSLVGIATSANFPQKGYAMFPKEVQEELKSKGMAVVPVGDFSYVLTTKFLEDLPTHNVLDQKVIPVTCPVRLLHGMEDTSVSYKVAMDMAQKLWSRDVHVLLRKSSDHRFSQPDDIEMMFETLDYLVYGAKEVRDLALNSWSSSSMSQQPKHMIDHARIETFSRD